MRAEYMDGDTPRRTDREASSLDFDLVEKRIICNVGVLTTGVDLDVRCIIDAKPTRSRSALRPDDRPRPADRAEGKTIFASSIMPATICVSAW